MPFFPKTLVLVPLDFSDASMRALDVALGLVDEPAHVRIVHVLQDLSPLEAGEVWGVVDPQTRIDAARNQIRQKLFDSPVQPAQIEVRLGDPAHGIADYAVEVKAQLIVLPSHGRTGITRLVMGSVAERVVRFAHCPVLVLRD
jgi:nucleotide-binding universal stress UspA family protein